jgi:hypothetical protein
VNSELICIWPDGTWCYKYELHEMTHMGDDYETKEFCKIWCDPVHCDCYFSCLTKEN